MSEAREALIRRAHRLGIYSGDDFIRAEEQAVRLQEFTPYGIPTFAQTGDVAKKYMLTYTDLTSQQIALGLDIRKVRSEEAVGRVNDLYTTERAIRMQDVTVDGGVELPLNLPDAHRRRQLIHLGAVARDPHINLRIVPEDAVEIDFISATQMDFADGTNMVWTTENRDTVVNTDPESIARYNDMFAHLAQVALSPEETLDTILRHRKQM